MAAVAVSLKELEEGTVPFAILEDAFGPSSLGIIIVKDLSERFVHLRQRVLSYSSYLANLPDHERDRLEQPASKYLTGWSLGKESLKPGVPDTLKGSYYVNCAFQADSKLDCAPCASPDGRVDFSQFTEYTTPNAWPAEDLLSGFRDAVQELCNLIIEVAGSVAEACDLYAMRNVDGYEPGYLERMVKGSLTTKARLLHYFPPTQESLAHAEGLTGAETGDRDDWCATHVDHGCLTGLTSAMYVDEGVHEPVRTSQRTGAPLAALPELEWPPDDTTGLYIHSRSGAVTKVNIPRDCLAFQTGEALERITKGKFRAVPHFVQGLSARSVSGRDGSMRAGGGTGKIARNTLAVFTQPNLWEMIDHDKRQDFAAFAREIAERHA